MCDHQCSPEPLSSVSLQSTETVDSRHQGWRDRGYKQQEIWFVGFYNKYFSLTEVERNINDKKLPQRKLKMVLFPTFQTWERQTSLYLSSSVSVWVKCIVHCPKSVFWFSGFLTNSPETRDKRVEQTIIRVYKNKWFFSLHKLLTAGRTK